MTNEERCWQTGFYDDDTFCECCPHQTECSGNDKDVGRGMNAIWVMDYDMHADKCYNTLGCPKCNEPIGKCKDGKFRCFNCGNVVFVKDKTMLDWYKKRSETKTEYEDCFPEEIEMKNGEVVKMGCGGKGTVRVVYRRNPVTMEWQTAYGECTKCGMRFIV